MVVLAMVSVVSGSGGGPARRIFEQEVREDGKNAAASFPPFPIFLFKSGVWFRDLEFESCFESGILGVQYCGA
jgi:hypothetical protein